MSSNIIDLTKFEGILENLAPGTRIIDTYAKLEGTVVGYFALEEDDVLYLIRFDNNRSHIAIVNAQFIEKIPIPNDSSIRLI